MLLSNGVALKASIQSRVYFTFFEDCSAGEARSPDVHCCEILAISDSCSVHMP